IERNPFLDAPTVERLLEGSHIAPDDRRVQSQSLAAEKEPFRSELSPLGIQQLVQHVTSAFGIALGPEVGHELVPTEAHLSGGGQEGQDGEAAALGSGARKVLLATREREAAEGAELKHEVPVDS